MKEKREGQRQIQIDDWGKPGGREITGIGKDKIGFCPSLSQLDELWFNLN
jgi:hypothetical protein